MSTRPSTNYSRLLFISRRISAGDVPELLNGELRGGGSFRLHVIMQVPSKAKKGATEMKSLTKSTLQKLVAAAMRRSQLALPVAGRAAATCSSAFFGLCVNAGKAVLAAMMEAERAALCGPRACPNPTRAAYRGGHTRSQVDAGRPAHRASRGRVPAASRPAKLSCRASRGPRTRSAGRGDDGRDCRGRVHAPLRTHAGRCRPTRRRCRCPRARCRAASWP